MRFSWRTAAGLVAVVMLLSGCHPTGFNVYVSATAAPALESFFEFLPEANGKVITSSNPTSDVSNHGSAVGVALVQDLTCGDCYKVTGSGQSWQVHAGDLLGLQYGLAELLEAFNFRFFHPWAVKAPSTLVPPTSSPRFNVTLTPQMSLRGIHLHTLHPIEANYAYWDTSDPSPDDARRINDWIVKNRGNYVEWSALNNIVAPGPAQQAWITKTQAIIADAHQRGLKVGIGTEMFGTANLQLSYDIFDTETEPDPTMVADQRLGLLLNGLPFDNVDISFGEFTGSSPDVFISSLNTVDNELKNVAPGTVLDATIHMDNSPGLQVMYDGQTLPYYFLVQFANPDIVPWIHSVMYFDLFEPADGAYSYQNFDLHLGYLQKQLQNNQPVGYFPESAYWVAFDDAVPTYLPVYMHSRWLDMNQISAQATQGNYAQLAQHVEFSSGWEWGYWQNDYATLRMNWSLSSQWTDYINDMFAPWGTTGAKLAAQIGALGELQDQFLIQQALAAYVSAQDYVIDYGAAEGTVSQPLPVQFSAIPMMTPTQLEAFQSSVLQPLATFLTQTQQIQSAIAALDLDASDPWLSEVIDGVDVDEARIRYIGALYEAVATFAMTGNDGGWAAKATTALSDGQAIIQRRDSHLHYPNPTLILAPTVNATLYQYGYLYEGATSCYWQREMIQAQNVLQGTSTAVPPCVL